MNHTRKMTIVPHEQLENKPPEYKFTEPIIATTNKKKTPNLFSPSDKLIKIIRIALRLANINAYDENGNIRGSDGRFIPETNIINLLNYSVSFGKLLKGENEFIKLLSEANVPFDWIINENVKKRMVDVKQYTEIRKPYLNENMDISENNKRKKDENEQTFAEISSKKRKFVENASADSPIIEHSEMRKRKLSEEPEENVEEKRKRIDWEDPEWKEDE